MSEMVIKDKEEQARLWLYHKIDDLEKEIAALREENERLKRMALDWKKWPEEKPKDSDQSNLIGWDNETELPYEMTPSRCWREEDSFHWVEIPRPEES